MISLELEKAEALMLQKALEEYLGGFEFDKDKLAFHPLSRMLLLGIAGKLSEELGRG